VSTIDHQLHGRPVQHQRLLEEGYESPEEYADQGDTRVIRDLLFGYTYVATDPAGNESIQATEVMRNEEVTIEQIGLLGLQKGERNHSFYTTAELERLANPGAAAVPAGSVTLDNLGEQGEYELAEWLASENPETGKAWTIDEVLEAVGEDKELAHRMLQAENIRSDGDARKGLEAGLTRIIQQ
jgi:hypothetical protein